MTKPAPWQLLIYRMPVQPSSARVAIWRDLRRLGALPLQQSCVVVPDLPLVIKQLEMIVGRIGDLGGQSFLYRLVDLSPRQAAELERGWSALRAQEYDEIVEECRTKFLKEVEFEIFRDNLTAAEAEELEADLEKIRAWYGRVRARDWFGTEKRLDVETAIADCATRLEEFTTLAFEREHVEGPSLEPPLEIPWGETGDAGILPLRRRAGGRRTRSAGGGSA